MKLKVSRNKVTEGDIVEVKWASGRAKAVSGTVLTVDNGFRKASVPVGSSGVKKFRLNRSDGQTVISVTAVEDGVSVSARKMVTVVPPTAFQTRMKAAKAEAEALMRKKKEERERRRREKAGQKKYDTYTRVVDHPVRDFFKKMFRGGSGRLSCGWKNLPPQKKHSWTMLCILSVCFFISIFHPQAAFYGLGILTIYLIWTLL